MAHLFGRLWAKSKGKSKQADPFSRRVNKRHASKTHAQVPPLAGFLRCVLLVANRVLRGTSLTSGLRTGPFSLIEHGRTTSLLGPLFRLERGKGKWVFFMNLFIPTSHNLPVAYSAMFDVMHASRVGPLPAGGMLVQSAQGNDMKCRR